MSSTTTQGSSMTTSEDEPNESRVGTGSPHRRQSGNKTVVAIVAMVLAGSVMLLLGGDDDSRAPADGAVADDGDDNVPGDAEPLPPRPVLPSECQLADATLVVELMANVSLAGAGGVDNSFVAESTGAFDRVVSARVLGAGSTGEFGLWGVTPDGGFAALNDVAREITIGGDDSGVGTTAIDDARDGAAADVVTKCAKLSTGG